MQRLSHVDYTVRAVVVGVVVVHLGRNYACIYSIYQCDTLWIWIARVMARRLRHHALDAYQAHGLLGVRVDSVREEQEKRQKKTLDEVCLHSQRVLTITGIGMVNLVSSVGRPWFIVGIVCRCRRRWRRLLIHWLFSIGQMVMYASWFFRTEKLITYDIQVKFETQFGRNVLQ